MENLRKEIEKVVALYADKKFTKAEADTKKIIRIYPKTSFLYNLLGLILSAQKKNDEAIDYYEKGIKISPNYAMIYNNLGIIYKSRKNYIKAKNYYKKSIELDNKIPEAHNNLGNLYIDLNKEVEAIKSFKKAIISNPKFYVAYFNLGILYKSAGDFEESKKNLEEAIKLYPRFYNAHRALSQLYKYEVVDSHIKLMQKLYHSIYDDIQGKISLSFSLGKAFDDMKKYKSAIKYYDEGNKLRRSTIKFSIKKENEEFANIKKVFNKNFIKKYTNTGNSSKSPIFIIGMPRSGTSLVEQIISSHSQVYGGGEVNYFNDLIKNNFFTDKYFSGNKNNFNNKNFKNIGIKYIDRIKEFTGTYKKVTDKLPINFKWVGFIKLILPNSKIIHCTRNPKDICISIYKNYFTNNELNYAYNFDELVDFYNLYKDLMNYWNENIPNSIIEVNYEKLITHPDKEIRKIIKSCDLKWENNCLKFYKNTRIVKTASDTQIRNKIYVSSKNSWKNYHEFFKNNFSKLIN